LSPKIITQNKLLIASRRGILGLDYWAHNTCVLCTTDNTSIAPNRQVCSALSRSLYTQDYLHRRLNQVDYLEPRGAYGLPPCARAVNTWPNESQSENPGSNPVLCVRAMDTFIHCTFIHVHSLYVVHGNSARLSD